MRKEESKRRLVVLILVLVLIQAGLVYWGVQTTKTNRKEELTAIEHQRQKRSMKSRIGKIPATWMRKRSTP